MHTHDFCRSLTAICTYRDRKEVDLGSSAHVHHQQPCNQSARGGEEKTTITDRSAIQLWTGPLPSPPIITSITSHTQNSFYVTLTVSPLSMGPWRNQIGTQVTASYSANVIFCRNNTIWAVTQCESEKSHSSFLISVFIYIFLLANLRVRVTTAQKLKVTLSLLTTKSKNCVCVLLHIF